MHSFDLKLFRKSKTKLSQEEFAKQIGFSKGTIGKIEAGYAPVTDNILDKIEEVFGVSLEEHKSYHHTRYKRPSGAAETNVVSEHPEQYYASQHSLVALLREQTQNLENCRKEKEELLLRISELEKKLLSTEQESKGK